MEAEARAKTAQGKVPFSESERRCVCSFAVAASFHCLVAEWKDCEELEPKPKEKLIFVDKKREERNIERLGGLRPTSIDV